MSSNKQESLTGATILLLHIPDSTQKSAQAADRNGHFSFNNVKKGKYIIKAGTVSFNNAYSTSFDYTGQPVILPIIVMNDKSNNLKEVAVIATVPQLQQKSNCLVVNVVQTSSLIKRSSEIGQKNIDIYTSIRFVIKN